MEHLAGHSTFADYMCAIKKVSTAGRICPRTKVVKVAQSFFVSPCFATKLGRVVEGAEI